MVDERTHKRLLEANRRHQDKIASINDQMEEGFKKIDWKRRKKAESDIVCWVKTYCMGVFLDDPPPKIGEEILREMWRAVLDSRPYMIEMSRGAGKTSYVECVLMCALATGKRRFPVLVSQNATSSQNLLTDLFRIISDGDTPFANDYPEVCLPFNLTNGSYRRRQEFNGHATEICKNSSKLVLARLVNEDGSELQCSNSCVQTRGILSGVRGLKHHTLRPDLVLIDDPQVDESAGSQEQVEKLYQVIQKSILNLSGKGKLAVMMTATPICQDDLVERIEHDKAWKVTKFPAIIQWPKDILENPSDGLWSQYFKLYDEENATDSNHSKSLSFYRKNRKKMDEGVEVLNPQRFKKEDGHISAIQSLLEKRHQIGNDAFQSEYQMKPKVESGILDIKPKTVLGRINADVERDCVPDGYLHTFCTIDLNTSYGVTFNIVSFKPDSSSVVLRHNVYRVNIDQALNGVQYNQAVYNALTDVGKRIVEFGVPLDGIGVDGGGKNLTAVCEWCKNASKLVGVPACAMLGRSAIQFNPLVRSRLRNAVGRTVLCGDEREHIKSQSGFKWLGFDADHFKEVAQSALKLETGSPGGCSLYNDLTVNHLEFATQVCNEQLRGKKAKANGQVEFTWKSKDPHDFLDTMAMAYALACFHGISSEQVVQKNIGRRNSPIQFSNTQANSVARPMRPLMRRPKRTIRIV